jgi:hypothetical protein
MTDDQLLALLTATDPYRSGTPLPEGWTAHDVLLAIEWRTQMETATRVEPRQKDSPHPRTWRGALIGAAAFVVVVATVGAGIWFATGRNTPVAGRGETRDPIETVEAFAAAVSAGETDLSEFVTDDATYTRLGTWPIDADLAAYWATLATRINLSGCELTALLVTCDGTHRNAIYDAMDRELADTWTFLVTGDGIIQQVLEDYSYVGEEDFPVRDYLGWLYAHRPDWVDDVEYTDPATGHTSFGRLETLPEAFLVLNRHNGEILTAHVDAYRADLDATGGLPEDWTDDRWGTLQVP